MQAQTEGLRVTLAASRFYPVAFRWQGRMVRVLSIENVRLIGTERRCRVRTADGYFELGLYAETGVWLLRRKPTLLGRVMARWHNAPRYPLPVWQRRVYKPRSVRPSALVNVGKGGEHVGRLALVRQ